MIRIRLSSILAPILASILASGLLTACGGAQKRAARSEGDVRALRLDLAQTFIQKGAHVAALPLLSRLIEEQPGDVHVRTLYAVVLRERGLYEQSEHQFRRAIADAPGYAPAHAGLAVVYDLTRRPRSAERAHLRATGLAPQNASFWNNFGFSRLAAGDPDGAIDALEKACALDPSMRIAYNNLGFAYSVRDRWGDALRSFRVAVGPARAHLNLAIAYADAGRVEEADRARERAVELDPALAPAVVETIAAAPAAAETATEQPIRRRQARRQRRTSEGTR